MAARNTILVRKQEIYSMGRKAVKRVAFGCAVHLHYPVVSGHEAFQRAGLGLGTGMSTTKIFFSFALTLYFLPFIFPFPL